MHMSEAAELAETIDCTPGWVLLAIGRFTDPAELVDRVEDKPWGCSAYSIANRKSTVVWSREAWEKLAAPGRERREAKDDRRIVQPVHGRTAPIEHQPLLF